MSALPRWYHSRKGMVAVIVLGGYMLAPMLGKALPPGVDELARIVVVALFLTANGEGDHALAKRLVNILKDRQE